jgi:lysophospholipase L1-like esterase
VGTRNDDISLILAKAKKQGFLPDVKDEEVDILSAEARNMFNSDLSIGNVISKKGALGNGFVSLGDSQTIGAAFDTGVQAAIGPSWPAYAAWGTGQKLRLIRNAGIAGNRSDQMLARFDTDVAPYNPSIVTLLAGANDISQNIALSVFQDNIKQIVDKITSINAVPVLCTILPRTPSATYGARVSQWNAWLKAYALTNGIAIIDFNSILTDPTTGAILFDSGDGLHPSQAGYQAMGDYAASVLKPLLREWNPILPVSNVDPNNLLANGLMITDTTPADGRADGWSTYGSGVTYTLEAGVSPVLGNWQKCVNTVAGAGITKSVSTGWSVGDKVAFIGRFDTDGASFIAQILATSAAGGPYLRTVGTITTAVRNGVFYGEFIVPAGTTALETRITGGIGTHKLAQFGLYNLTALGL